MPLAVLTLTTARSGQSELLSLVNVDYTKGAKQTVSVNVDKLDDFANQGQTSSFYLFGQVVLEPGTAKNPNIEALRNE